MTTSHGSFDSSPHGFFIQSQHLFRNRIAATEPICIITHARFTTSAGSGMVTRIDPDNGDTIWTFDLGLFTAGAGQSDWLPGRVAIGPDGSIYVVAWLQNAVNPHPRGMVVKLDRDGEEIWRTEFATTNQTAAIGLDPRMPGIALDPSISETELIAASEASSSEPDGFWRLDCETGDIIRGYRRQASVFSGATPVFFPFQPDGKWFGFWYANTSVRGTIFDDSGAVLWEGQLRSFDSFVTAVTLGKTSNKLYYAVEGPGPFGTGGVTESGGTWDAFHKLQDSVPPSQGFATDEWSTKMTDSAFVPEVTNPPLLIYGGWGDGQPYTVHAIAEVGTTILAGARYQYIEENQFGNETGRRWGYNLIALDSTSGAITKVLRRHNPVPDQTDTQTNLNGNGAAIRGIAYDADSNILISLANTVGVTYGVHGFAGPLERWETGDDFTPIWSVDPRVSGTSGVQYNGVAIRTVQA